MKLAELVKYPFLTLASHTNVRSILDRAFEDAGHMVHHDNPEGLAQAVAEFLNR